MDKRRANRIKHRLTCELLIGQQAYPAVVRDLGPTGLFVQTRARPNANSVVEIRFPTTAGLPGFQVEAGVARHRNVHPRLQAEIQSGIGLEILGRPADYLAYMKRVGGTQVQPQARPQPQALPQAERLPAAATSRSALPRSPSPAAQPAKQERLAMHRFRVRMVAIGRSAPRTLLVHGANADEARAEAISRAGAGWRITDVETI